MVFLGTLFAGGIVTTLNPLYTEREVREQFDDSTPTVVFAVEATAPAVRAVWGDRPGFHLTRRRAGPRRGRGRRGASRSSSTR